MYMHNISRSKSFGEFVLIVLSNRKKLIGTIKNTVKKQNCSMQLLASQFDHSDL